MFTLISYFSFTCLILLTFILQYPYVWFIVLIQGRNQFFWKYSVDHFHNSSWTEDVRLTYFFLSTFNYCYYMASPVSSKLGTDINQFLLQLIFSVPTQYFITLLGFIFILSLLTSETILLFILHAYLLLNFTVFPIFFKLQGYKCLRKTLFYS